MSGLYPPESASAWVVRPVPHPALPPPRCSECGALAVFYELDLRMVCPNWALGVGGCRTGKVAR